MRTDELITLLATGVPAVDKHLFGKRFALALVVSVLGAALLMTLLFGVRPDLAQVARLPLFYAKLALPVALLPGALYLTRRTACAGGRVGGAWVVSATGPDGAFHTDPRGDACDGDCTCGVTGRAPRTCRPGDRAAPARHA